MMENVINSFCETIKSLLRVEWEKWLKAFKIYLITEEINSPIRKKSKLLHFGWAQLQSVPFFLPDAVVDNVDKDINILNVLAVLQKERVLPNLF